MTWDFETDPDYQQELDWADRFVREMVEPLDYASPTCSSLPSTAPGAGSWTPSRTR